MKTRKQLPHRVVEGANPIPYILVILATSCIHPAILLLVCRIPDLQAKDVRSFLERFSRNN